MKILSTHCMKGHEFTTENTIVNPRPDRVRPTRRCRVCYNASIRVAGKKWRDSHPEENTARHEDYRRENLVALRAKSKEYRLNNLEQCKDAISAWKKENPDKLRSYFHKRRAIAEAVGGYFTAEEWFTLCFACGFKCACCREVKPLAADHVIPVALGGPSWLWNIQPLCQPCNSKKGTKIIDYRETLGENHGGNGYFDSQQCWDWYGRR
jgi:5-methylcytosine-specific restriction endonuclease McrA